MNSHPIVSKAKVITGKTLRFRNAQISDAAFILSLRTDEDKSRHLTSVSNILSDQEEWLKEYDKHDDEAYFIIENTLSEPLGTVRLYDGVGHSFCWGSWVVKNGAKKSVAIESALMVYSYAIDTLGFSSAHFQVNKENKRVCVFHERFGAERTAEDDTQFEYIITNKAICKSVLRYSRYLPNSLKVEK